MLKTAALTAALLTATQAYAFDASKDCADTDVFLNAMTDAGIRVAFAGNQTDGLEFAVLVASNGNWVSVLNDDVTICVIGRGNNAMAHAPSVGTNF